MADDQQLSVDIYRVEYGTGFSFPRIALLNRRSGGAYPRTLYWICQRHLEALLFGRSDGGSSGAIWKILNISGLGATSLCCTRKAVQDGHITEAEYLQIMSVYKQHLPSSLVDPSSLGRIRSCTLLPVATAALVCRQHGRSAATTAWLTAFSQSVPDSWQLHAQAEQDAAAGVPDHALESQLDDASFEVEDISFRDELTSMPVFEPSVDDEQRMATYVLSGSSVSPMLKKELGEFVAYRTATFAARRQGGAVQSISAEHDKLSLLRFFGFLEKTNRVPHGQLLCFTLMIRADLGDLVQEYASWLQNTQRCRFSSIANYLNGLVSITSFCYANLEPTDTVLNSDPNPLAQIINLRGQAEKASKLQGLFDKRVGGWLDWQQVQQARVTAVTKLNEMAGMPLSTQRAALRDAAALSLLSLIPPDRVGIIRKLRLGHTLKKKPGGGS